MEQDILQYGCINEIEQKLLTLENLKVITENLSADEFIDFDNDCAISCEDLSSVPPYEMHAIDTSVT